MNRHEKLRTMIAQHGVFQPGDGTRYEFLAVPYTEEHSGEIVVFAAGSLMRGHTFPAGQIRDCYDRNRDAIGQWATQATNRALADHFIDYITEHTGAMRATAWAFVQWYVESYGNTEDNHE